MNRLSRSQALKIAAGILLVLSLLDLVVYEMPALMLGQAATDMVANTTEGPPFFMVLLSSAMDILAIAAAYGLWRGQRWGVIFGIIISAFNIFGGLAAIVSAGDVTIRIIAGFGVLVAVVAMVLCLWREPRPHSRTAQLS